MRHRARRPFLDLLHRIPRTLAVPIGRLGQLGSLRFAAGLLAAMVVGTGAFVAVASMGDGAEDPVAGPSTPVDRSGSEASRSAERPELPDTSAPARGSGAPAPSGSPAKERASQDAESPSASAAGDPVQDATQQAGSAVPSPGTGSTTSSGTSSPDGSPGSPSGGSPAAPSPSDQNAPQTTLSADYPSGDTATFTFGADEVATFACSLDGSAFTSCTSGVTYADLPPGKHTFQVRATDLAGNVDPTPASVTWHANRGPSVDD